MRLAGVRRRLPGRRGLAAALAAVIVVATVGFVAASGGAQPAAAAPGGPQPALDAGRAAAPGDDEIPFAVWNVCRAVNGLQDMVPFDPTRPFDFDEWSFRDALPPVIAMKLALKGVEGLMTLLKIAIGTVTGGRFGTTPWEFFVGELQKWTPPEGKYAPEWYLHAIKSDRECMLIEADVHRGCGDLPSIEPIEDAFIPDHCWGTYPANNFDLGYDESFGLTAGLLDDLWGITANLLFTMAATAIQLGLWLLGWAFSFNVRKFDPIVLGISHAYNTRIVGALELKHVAWVVLIGWAGFAILRRRAGSAASELLTSVVLIALTAGLMGNLDGYLSGAWDTMDRGSNLVFAASADKAPCDPTPGSSPSGEACAEQRRAFLAPAQKSIQQVFIEDTYDYLNWGGSFATERCRTARNQIVSAGPHGDSGWPRRHMERAAAAAEKAGDTAAAEECRAAAKFNADPRSERWIGALLNLVMASFVFFLLLASSVTLLAAKFLVAVCFMLAPLAAVFAIAPGGGRRLAWQWVGAVVQGIAAVLGVSLVLSLLLLAMQAMFTAMADVSLIERLMIGNLLVIAGMAGRRRIVAGTQAAASTVATKLSGFTAAGAAAGPVSAGMDLASTDARMRRMVTAPATLGGKIIAQRARERRSWHNIIKARRRGDRMAAVAHKTYYSDVPGGSHGPGPRGGYGDVEPPPGPGPGPGPEPGAEPGPEPDPADGTTAASPPGSAGKGGRRARQGRRSGRRRARSGSSRRRARPASRQRGRRAAAPGRAVGPGVRGGPAVPAGPGGPGVRGGPAIPAGPGGPGGTDGGRPGQPAVPGAPRGTARVQSGGPPRSRGPAPREASSQAAPAPRNRLIHEVIVTEQEAPWRFPRHALSDRFYNKIVRQHGRSVAKRRGLD